MKMYRIFGFVATKELPSAPPRLFLPAQKQGGGGGLKQSGSSTWNERLRRR